jgi:hypothetical protein
MTKLDSSGAVPLEVLELLGWLAREPRTHRETIETWGSHCPRITTWEDAQDSGLVRVTRSRERDGRLAVVLTRSGRAALEASTVDQCARGSGLARDG